VDLSLNLIAELPAELDALQALYSLDLSHNKLSHMSDLDGLSRLGNLESLNLLGNPVALPSAAQSPTLYRSAMIALLGPKLINLDEEEVGTIERQQQGASANLESAIVPNGVQQHGVEAAAAKLQRENEILKAELEKAIQHIGNQRSTYESTMQNMRTEVAATSQLLVRKTSEWAQAEQEASELRQELAFMRIDNNHHDPVSCDRAGELLATNELGRGAQLTRSHEGSAGLKIDAPPVIRTTTTTTSTPHADTNHSLRRDFAPGIALVALLPRSKHKHSLLSHLERLDPNGTVSSIGREIEALHEQTNLQLKGLGEQLDDAERQRQAARDALLSSRAEYAKLEYTRNEAMDAASDVAANAVGGGGGGGPKAQKNDSPSRSPVVDKLGVLESRLGDQVRLLEDVMLARMSQLLPSYCEEEEEDDPNGVPTAVAPVLHKNSVDDGCDDVNDDIDDGSGCCHTTTTSQMLLLPTSSVAQAREMLMQTDETMEPSELDVVLDQVHALVVDILRQHSAELPEELCLALDNQQARRFQSVAKRARGGANSPTTSSSRSSPHRRRPQHLELFESGVTRIAKEIDDCKSIMDSIGVVLRHQPPPPPPIVQAPLVRSHEEVRSSSMSAEARQNRVQAERLVSTLTKRMEAERETEARLVSQCNACYERLQAAELQLLSVERDAAMQEAVLRLKQSVAVVTAFEQQQTVVAAGQRTILRLQGDIEEMKQVSNAAAAVATATATATATVDATAADGQQQQQQQERPPHVASQSGNGVVQQGVQDCSNSQGQMGALLKPHHSRQERDDAIASPFLNDDPASCSANEESQARRQDRAGAGDEHWGDAGDALLGGLRYENEGAGGGGGPERDHRQFEEQAQNGMQVDHAAAAAADEGGGGVDLGLVGHHKERLKQMRNRLYEELLVMERHYVRDLEAFAHVVLLPMRKRALLPPNQLHKVASNIMKVRTCTALYIYMLILL
jgi:hypothetical protein